MNQTTPYMANKRTPGTMASDPPSQANLGMMNDQSPGAPPVLNASRSVTDRFTTNSKQLLNAYIYDFLVKNTFSETAKLFVLEADVPTVAYDLRHSSSKTSPIMLSNDAPDKEANGSMLAHSTPQTPTLSISKFLEEHNIPNLSLSMDAPQGFLYEWWQVFWDVHNVKNNKQSSAAATQYHQMQLMKLNQPDLNSMGLGQVQLQQLGSMNIFPNMAMGQAANMQGRYNGQAAPSGPVGSQGQPFKKQASLADSRQQRQMMQIMMKQQQQQQQHHQQYQQHQQQLQNQQHQLFQSLHQLQLHQQQNQQLPHQIQQLPHQNQQLSHQSEQLQQQQTPNQTPQHAQSQQAQIIPAQRDQSSQTAQSAQSQSAPSEGPFISGVHRTGTNGPVMDQVGLPIFVQNGQNRNQQQAQTQMNNLRQQAAVSQGPGQGPAAAAVAAVTAAASAAANSQSLNAASPVMNGVRANHARPMRPGPSPNGGAKHMQYQQIHPQQQQILQQQQQQQQQLLQQRLPQQGQQMPQQIPPQMPQQMQNLQLGMPQPGTLQHGGMQQHPLVQQMLLTQPNMFGMPPSPYGQQNSAGPAPPLNPNVQPPRNMNALQDYQMQLMLLEKQNKKRLDIARFNVGGEATMAQAGLEAPKQSSPAPSPHPTSRASPGTAAPKQKRALAAKRTRKPSANGSTPQSAGTDNSINPRAGTKKKAASPELEVAKKRKKSPESPKKGVKTPTLKKEKPKKEDKPDERRQSTEGKMPPPNAFYSQPLAERVSTDILGNGGSGDGVNFFTSGGNSSIDDIDFDFNLFLDGGDEGMSGGLSGFSWGNPVEGE